VRELAAAGLLDEQVTAWARANDIDGLALPLAKWVGSYLADRFDDLDTEEWPDWVTAYFTVPAETRTDVVDRVAAAIHTVIHQPQPTLSDPELRQAAIDAFTAAADTDEALTNRAQYLGQAPFTETFHAWADTWFTEHWTAVPLDDRPDWVTVYELAQGEDSRTDLLDQVATAVQEHARTSAPPEEPPARNERTGPPESVLGPMDQAFTEAESLVPELFINAALADELVTGWARESELDAFAGKFTEWADAWVTELLGDAQADDLPMPIRFFVHRADWVTAERILAQAAATVHATIRPRLAQDNDQSPPAAGQSEPADPAIPAEPALPAESAEPLEPGAPGAPAGGARRPAW
ncbi:hypothetical protein ACFV9B_45020, partial [Kitasatospora purpeofusca]